VYLTFIIKLGTWFSLNFFFKSSLVWVLTRLDEVSFRPSNAINGKQSNKANAARHALKEVVDNIVYRRFYKLNKYDEIIPNKKATPKNYRALLHS
jgi:hypothetical protein